MIGGVANLGDFYVIGKTSYWGNGYITELDDKFILQGAI